MTSYLHVKITVCGQTQTGETTVVLTVSEVCRTERIISSVPGDDVESPCELWLRAQWEEELGE